jgi:hypothetical protein
MLTLLYEIVEVLPLEYSSDQLYEFCRYKATKQAIIGSVDLLQKKQDYPEIERTITAATQIGRGGSGQLDVVNLAGIERKEVEWFWSDRIPRGKLSLIVGDPGVGKSFFTMMLTAYITKGRALPGTPELADPEEGKVIVLTAEDGLADTVVPRIEDHGGDKANVFVIQGTKAIDGTYRLFNLQTDVAYLEAKILELKNAKLIIIDPISAYLGVGTGVDSHKDKDVRGVLAPLAAMAEKHNVTIIGIVHLNKRSDVGAIYRVSGSMAFVAAARSVWLIEREKAEEKDRSLRYFTPLKTNLSVDPKGLVFRIECGVITFQDGMPPTADECLASKAIPQKERPREHAKQFLREMLKNGPVDSKQILEEAKGNGITIGTLQNAKEALGIESFRIGGLGEKGKWIWQLAGTTP